MSSFGVLAPANADIPTIPAPTLPPGNPEKILVQNIFNKTPDKENILNICCDELGYIELHSSTKEALNDYIQEDEFKINKEFISILIKLIVSSREYQMV